MYIYVFTLYANKYKNCTTNKQTKLILYAYKWCAVPVEQNNIGTHCNNIISNEAEKKSHHNINKQHVNNNNNDDDDNIIIGRGAYV